MASGLDTVSMARWCYLSGTHLSTAYHPAAGVKRGKILWHDYSNFHYDQKAMTTY